MRTLFASLAALSIGLASGCRRGVAVSADAGSSDSGTDGGQDAGPASGFGKIKHIVVIMQENRSFDHYFGTFLGADGLPAGVCAPDTDGGCVAPFRDINDVNAGGTHGSGSAIADINGGKMDGFVLQQANAKESCVDPNNPMCAGSDRPARRAVSSRLPPGWQARVDRTIPIGPCSAA